MRHQGCLQQNLPALTQTRPGAGCSVLPKSRQRTECPGSPPKRLSRHASHARCKPRHASARREPPPPRLVGQQQGTA
eukprot:12898011-Prorocentrum_lima.AAC.1